MTRRALLWAVAALLGLAVTAALTWSVSRLTRERIGLSSEPPSVLNGLAPTRTLPSGRGNGPGVSRPAGRRPSAGPPAPNVTTPSTAPPPVAPANPRPNRGDNRDDSGGSSRTGSGGPDD